MEHKRFKASVTIFLSMIMLLLVGLIMCLVEVTKIHNMKSYKRVAAEGAIESVFAEYHQELRKNYGLFGLDASYRGGDYSPHNVLERFEFYGGSGDESTIETLQLMTDNNGAGFLDQVLFYMMDTTGLSYFEDLIGMTTQWESTDIQEGVKGEEGLMNLESLKDSANDLGEEGVENPLSSFLHFDYSGILNFVVKNKGALSEGSIDLNTLPSQRHLEVGYGTTLSLDNNAITSKLAVSEYAMNVLTNAGTYLSTRNEESGDYVDDSITQSTDNINELVYQLEYLIGGKDSDKENLKSVVHKLLLIRTPVNYACLQGDSVKKGEVKLLAVTLASLAGIVGTEGVIEESLLWAWSYAESMADVKSLLSGYSLNLTKSSGQWQLGLSNLLSFGNSDLTTNEDDEGMDYKEFLRILLYLESIETLTVRAMDMVELGIRNMEGMELFHLDYCISRLKLKVETEVGMGYNYSFPIEYGYR